MAIIKKRLKIDVSFYTVLQIPSLVIFEQIRLNQMITYEAYNPDERNLDNHMNLFN